jgi:hypothetical protein
VGLRSFRKRAERAAQRSAFQVAPFNEFIKRRKVLSSARTLSPRGRFIFASAHVKFILRKVSSTHLGAGGSRAEYATRSFINSSLCLGEKHPIEANFEPIHKLRPPDCTRRRAVED